MPEPVALEHLKLLYKAKIADKALCFKDMKEAMKELSLIKQCLNEEERKLLSSSFKHFLAPYRDTCKLARADAEYHEDPEVRTYAKQVYQQLKEVIIKFIKEVIQIIRFLRKGLSNELSAEAFYMKMQADYNRYLAEIDPTNAKVAEGAYVQAYALVNSFPKNHPVRLGVSMNYALLQYTILNDCAKALEILQNEIPDVRPSKTDMEAFQTYHLMKDSQKLWTQEMCAKLQPAA